MDDDDRDVARLRALLAAAGPLPWTTRDGRDEDIAEVIDARGHGVASLVIPAVAALIAEGVTALPALLDRLAALEANLASARADRARWTRVVAWLATHGLGDAVDAAEAACTGGADAAADAPLPDPAAACPACHGPLAPGTACARCARNGWAGR